MATRGFLSHGRTRIKTASDAPSIAICIPTKGSVPIEFMVAFVQVLSPLNVKILYSFQKGKLPAIARNDVLSDCLDAGVHYAWFLDDDVIFPDVTLYRLFGQAVQHPEAAVISAVIPTKIEPTEPLLYASDSQGAFWDWPLGTLVPIHSAGAGCLMVNLEWVRKLSPPYFDDVVESVQETPETPAGHAQYGHDRYFMRKLAAAGGAIYADTGLLLSHWDRELHKNYLLPTTAPCHQLPPLGEAYVPMLVDKGIVMWRRIIPLRDTEPSFLGYLDWLHTLGAGTAAVLPSLIADQAGAAVPALAPSNGGESPTLRRVYPTPTSPPTKARVQRRAPGATHARRRA